VSSAPGWSSRVLFGRFLLLWWRCCCVLYLLIFFCGCACVGPCFHRGTVGVFLVGCVAPTGFCNETLYGELVWCVRFRVPWLGVGADEVVAFGLWLFGWWVVSCFLRGRRVFSHVGLDALLGGWVGLGHFGVSRGGEGAGRGVVV